MDNYEKQPLYIDLRTVKNSTTKRDAKKHQNFKDMKWRSKAINNGNLTKQQQPGNQLSLSLNLNLENKDQDNIDANRNITENRQKTFVILRPTETGGQMVTFLNNNSKISQIETRSDHQPEKSMVKGREKLRQQSNLSTQPTQATKNQLQQYSKSILQQKQDQISGSNKSDEQITSSFATKTITPFFELSKQSKKVLPQFQVYELIKQSIQNRNNYLQANPFQKKVEKIKENSKDNTKQSENNQSNKTINLKKTPNVDSNTAVYNGQKGNLPDQRLSQFVSEAKKTIINSSDTQNVNLAINKKPQNKNFIINHSQQLQQTHPKESNLISQSQSISTNKPTLFFNNSSHNKQTKTIQNHPMMATMQFQTPSSQNNTNQPFIQQSSNQQKQTNQNPMANIQNIPNILSNNSSNSLTNYSILQLLRNCLKYLWPSSIPPLSQQQNPLQTTQQQQYVSDQERDIYSYKQLPNRDVYEQYLTSRSGKIYGDDPDIKQSLNSNQYLKDLVLESKYDYIGELDRCVLKRQMLLQKQKGSNNRTLTFQPFQAQVNVKEQARIVQQKKNNQKMNNFNSKQTSLTSEPLTIRPFKAPQSKYQATNQKDKQSIQQKSTQNITDKEIILQKQQEYKLYKQAIFKQITSLSFTFQKNDYQKIKNKIDRQNRARTLDLLYDRIKIPYFRYFSQEQSQPLRTFDFQEQQHILDNLRKRRQMQNSTELEEYRLEIRDNNNRLLNFPNVLIPAHFMLKIL